MRQFEGRGASRAHAVLNRVFGQAEEINGRNRCPTYLYRWRVWGGAKGRAAYIHHFVADDWTLDLHDHPKRFISIGLTGSYEEETAAGVRLFRAPWIRTFPATHAHRIRNPRRCWTFVIVLKATRLWGFWHQGAWHLWADYVRDPLADLMKACQ
jgi:hypothetical protein